MNAVVFAWSAYEASKVDMNFICHYFNVNPTIIPKKQPPQCSSKEHVKAVKEEVIKLKHARSIKEVFLPRVVGQYSCGEEEVMEVESLRGIY